MREGPVASTFGDLLREFRVRSGLSQGELAEKAGISEAAISALERGARKAPYRHTIARLAIALGLNTDESAEFVAARLTARKLPPKGAHNLQAERTSFVGRAAEVDYICKLLRRSRLVTVTGSGGVGKTRVAIEAARRLLGATWAEIWFVDLSPLIDGDFIASKIARSITPEPREQETLDALAAALASRSMLLILDNCEHVIEQAARAADAILERCPSVEILATSRERLNVAGEFVYRLPSLEEAPAIDLFVQRAEALVPRRSFEEASLPSVNDIVRRLNGIPLAIELMAAQVPVLGLEVLRARLDQEFHVPSGRRDLPARQLTVLATIEWSYNLLGADQRQMLCDVSIFAGTFGLAGAEEVCSAGSQGLSSAVERLAALVEKSLVTVQTVDGETRYSILESVRAFGIDRLRKEGRYEGVARKLATWLARQGDVVDAADLPYEDVHRLRLEIDSVRSAIAWSLNARSQDDLALGGRIVAGLADLWSEIGRTGEHHRWLEKMLERLDGARYPLIVAKMLRVLIIRAHFKAVVIELAQRAERLADRAGDAFLLARLHGHLIDVYAAHDRLEDAERSAMIAEQFFHDDKSKKSRLYATFLSSRAALRMQQGRFDDARADAAASQTIAVAIMDREFLLQQYFRHAQIELSAGNLRSALHHVERIRDSEIGERPDVQFVVQKWTASLNLLLGDIGGALPAVRELLQLVRGNESIDHAEFEFASFALMLRGEDTAATRILGYVQARTGVTQQIRQRARKTLYAQLCSSLPERLGESQFKTALDAGALLTHEQAIDEALAALESQQPV